MYTLIRRIFEENVDTTNTVLSMYIYSSVLILNFILSVPLSASSSVSDVSGKYIYSLTILFYQVNFEISISIW